MASPDEPALPVEVQRHEQPVEDPRGSWRFKLDRAQKHLEEIKEYSARYAQKRPYTARREIEGYGDLEFVVRAFLHDPPDHTLATIYGDFFFNLRSALDHIAVALAPDANRRSASFPIFKDDPRLLPKRNKRRAAFERSTKGLSDETMRVLLDLQPFNRPIQLPELDSLAVLDDFAQADKHRELLAFAQLIHAPETFLLDPSSGAIMYSQVRPDASFESGGIVAVFQLTEPLDESQVDVEVHGTVEVGLKRIDAGGNFILPGTVNALLAYVNESVIPPLEALL